MTKASYEMPAVTSPRDQDRGIINNAFQVDAPSGGTDSKAAASLSERCHDKGHDVKKDVEINSTEDDIYCGIGSCRPQIMQGCKNMVCFSVMYSIIGLVTSALITYINSQITTLEKHFNLSSSMSGFLMSCNDIGYLVTTLFMSYYTRRVHIPRALAACSIMYGISGLICTVAFFVTKDQLPSLTSDKPEESDMAVKKVTSVGFSQICQNWTTKSDSGYENTNASPRPVFDISEQWRTVAISIIAVGMILQGVAKSPRQAFLGTYVDDNVPKIKTSLYLGIMIGVSIFGPAVAYALGGVFSSMYITLEETSISPRDPRWLGAWWLGFLVFGGAGILVAIPLIFFPKRMHIQKSLEVVNEKYKVNKRGLARFWHDFKGILKAVAHLTVNPVFMCLTMASSLEMMSVAGIMAFIPKYMETQFTLPAGRANIIIGAMQIASAPVGTIVGGLLTSKLKLSPKACLKLTIGLKLTAICMSGLGFVIGCKQPLVLMVTRTNSSGTETESQCVQDCHCNSQSYFPICGQDGNSYFSPCHAGCSATEDKIFTNCSCMATKDSQVATGGLCVQECSFLYPYIALFFIGAFTSTMSIMPSFIAFVRSVKEEDKPLAIGLNAFSGTLLGWLPGPVVYGALIDSTCLLWKTSRSTSGACVLYNIELFRYRMHTLTVSLRSITITLNIIALVIAVCSRKTVFQPHEDDVSFDIPAKVQNEGGLDDVNKDSEKKVEKTTGNESNPTSQ